MGQPCSQSHSEHQCEYGGYHSPRVLEELSQYGRFTVVTFSTSVVGGGAEGICLVCSAVLPPTALRLLATHSHTLLPARAHAQQFEHAGDGALA